MMPANSPVRVCTWRIADVISGNTVVGYRPSEIFALPSRLVIPSSARDLPIFWDLQLMFSMDTTKTQRTQRNFTLLTVNRQLRTSLRLCANILCNLICAMRNFLAYLILLGILPFSSIAQHHQPQKALDSSMVLAVEPQPFLAQAIRLSEALSFIGSSLSEAEVNRLKALRNVKPDQTVVKAIQEILDPYCLFMVDINPEARVKVAKGPAEPRLAQHGWRSFLVKIKNDPGVNARLEVESPNALPPMHMSSVPIAHVPPEKNLLSPGQVANRFLELLIYRNRPLLPNLSGLHLEYAVLQVYCKDAGQREAEIGFNIGHGTQDIGFRNTTAVLFNIEKSIKVVLKVKDEDNSAAMASFTIRDNINHYPQDSLSPARFVNGDTSKPKPQAQTIWAMKNFMGINYPKRLDGVYPLPARRVAAYDEYPDFFFQSQVYRKDGEHILLTPGRYTITVTRGPEYLPQEHHIVIPEGKDSVVLDFKLKRWISLASLGWYSADHHVHASGCSHYESPEVGVTAADMWRQVLGEDLNVASVLTWGPGWYHQKQNFSGNTNPISTAKNLIRYDVEVSGFPSDHTGHIVLLRLKEDDYPGTKKIEDWPSWSLPVMKWAKGQAALTGYAHSGWGLEPTQPVKALPNYVVPKMDGIGANEYIVTVAHNLVDFFSAGDTPSQWELNMWYQSLNCGFRTRISGETDFPCIYDDRVGMIRSYFKSSLPLNFDSYVDALKRGGNYVSDGTSHIIDFSVDGVEMGTKESEVKVNAGKEVNVKARVAAYLKEVQDKEGAIISELSLTDPPYWDLERARVGKSRKVKVELIVNGEPVDATEITADGKWSNRSFRYKMNRSGWMALRIYPSVHTNPIFVIVDGKPINERKSVEWSIRTVEQCWKMKEPRIRAEEKAAAKEAYEQATKVYKELLK